MRLLVITMCECCPYSRPQVSSNGMNYAYLKMCTLKDCKNIPDENKIPKWCPMPKIEDIQK